LHDFEKRISKRFPKGVVLSLIRFVTATDLLEVPRPDPLIDGFIQEQDAVCLYGDPNGGKSFLGLDWALCVATGKPWLDIHEVKMGPVIYMAGEGAASLQVRVQAWMQHHRIAKVDGAYFQVRPLPLRDEDVIEDIQKHLEQFATPETGRAILQPRLIVVDTLSQFMMGGDENGPDMALFVSNCRRLSHDNNTAILIVHHTNKGGMGQERGHSSLRGNVDEMFKCMPVYQDNLLVGIDITNDKQRDKARAAALNLKLRVVPLGNDNKGRPVSSLVVVASIEPPSKLPTVKRELLDVLDAMLQCEDIRTERCQHVALEAYLSRSKATVWKQLDKLDVMKCVKKGTGRSSLTTLGRAVLDKAGITRVEEPEPEEDE
jgi:hypothetical protein